MNSFPGLGCVNSSDASTFTDKSVHATLSTVMVSPTLPTADADVLFEVVLVLDDDEEVLLEDEVVLDEVEVVGVIIVPVVACLVAALKAELIRAQVPMQRTNKTPRKISTHLSLPFFFCGCGGGCL